jgi:hypothetical protein
MAMETIKSREERMKERNVRQKDLARIIGQNLSFYVCIMIPVLLVGLIWTDTSLPTFGWGLLSDGFLTVVLFVIGERSMLNVGVTGGKLDDEYIETRRSFRELVAKVKGIGVLMMEPFCDWQIDMELIRAKRTRLRRIGIKYDKYVAEYEGKTFTELKEAVGAEKAAKITEINLLKPIELNPDLLLTEGYGSRDRRDIPDGAEKHIEKKKNGKVGLLVSVLTAIFTVAVTLALTEDVTLARVLYTAVKVIALLYRMAKGYSDGAKAYNTMEVRHLSAKIEYLTEYTEFMGNEIYLQIADKYPEIYTLLNPTKPTKPTTHTTNTEGEYEIQNQQFEQVAIECGY